MKDTLKDLAAAAKNVSGQASEALGEAASHLGKMGDVGGDVARGMADDVNRLLPAIKKAGYSVHGLDLDLALPPKFTIHCTMEIEIPPADREALLATLAESRISTIAVKALFELSDVQKRLSLGSLRPRDVLLEVGLSPGIRVRYRDRDSDVAAE